MRATLTTQTAAEICAEPVMDPNYILYRLAIPGAVTAFIGKMKRGGKTTFMLHALRQVTQGLPFLNQPTQKTSVVYLTEQAPRTFRSQLQAAGLENNQNLHVHYWFQTARDDWATIVAPQAVQTCQAKGAKLLVIDTLSQFAKLAGDSENSSGSQLAAVRPLQSASAMGLAVIVVVHERKAGGDLIDRGRGSSALAGAVDSVVGIAPVARAKPNVRYIEGLNRLEGAFGMTVEFTGEGYTLIGDGDDEAWTPPLDGTTLHTIPSNAEAAQTIVQIADTHDCDRTNALRQLEKLRQSGQVTRIGTGKSGDPFKYFRVSAD